jgi:hypothetical protein
MNQNFERLHQMKRAKVKWLAGTGLVLFGMILPVRALTINVTYDSSVTNIGTLTEVQTAIGAAVQTLENLYTNDITLNITVYSSDAGPFGEIDLGESNTHFVYNSATFKYPQVTNALRLARTTLADSNSVASLPDSDPTGGTQDWIIARAEAKALGVLNVSANNPAADGEVGFANDANYTFDPNHRTVSGKYDLIGVAEHEITEVMGRTTYNLNGSGYYVPYDLFRFTSSGVRSFDPYASDVYFSIDDGVTPLKYFYNDVNSGDIQDWASGATPDSFDAFVSDGNELSLSAADLIAVDILGYKLNYLPPRLTGTQLANGTFQLNFTETPGTTYTVLASTNISLSANDWTVLGTATEGNAGQFQFTDTQAANKTLRFYRVRLN